MKRRVSPEMGYTEDRPLAGQVSERIKQYIIENDLKTGDKLPTEATLIELFGVGRSTIREAIRSLVTQNVLSVRQGSGTYVSEEIGLTQDPLGFSFIRNKNKLASDLLEVRAVIEPEVAALAAQNATGEDIRELDKLYQQMETLLLAGEDYLDVDLLFHQRIAQASGNMVVPRLMPIISEAVDLFTNRTGYQLLQETLDTHKGVLEAIRSHDPIWAREMMLLHIAYNRNAMRNLERLERGLPPLAPKVPENIQIRKKKKPALPQNT
ncbi:MAG: FadR family transcriptional regulator [Clostridia bacterium]|nr:FadR family transcriptional regulator [Clostridia bacterium]